MTRYIIHAGPHKTGSTYLQTNLAKLRQWLHGQGILFPETWGPGAHHALQAQLAAKDAGPGLNAAFQAMNSAGHSHIVLSCEGLLGLPEERLAALKTLLGGAEATIVYYLRSWAALLPSFWKEEVKGGRMTRTLPDYLYRMVLEPRRHVLMNFALDIDRAIAVFGRANVRLVAYEKLHADNRDLFAHFMATFLGLTFFPAPRPARINVSLGAEETEILRAFAVLERRARGKPPPPRYFFCLLEAFLEAPPLTAGGALAAAMESCREDVHITDSSGLLMALHRELFAAYGDMLVAPAPKTLLFPPQSVRVPWIGPNYLAIPGIAEELQSLHAQLQTAALMRRDQDNQPAEESPPAPSALSTV